MNARTKKRVGLLVAVVAAAGLIGGGGYLLREHRRTVHMEDSRTEGLAAYAEQDWDLTLERLGYCVGRDLRDAEVYAAFADARWRVENGDGSHYRLAIVAAEAAISIEPDNREALSLLMDFYVGTQFYAKLLTTIDTVLKIDPTDKKALELTVLAHTARDESEEALAAADRFATAYPDDYPAQALRIEMMRVNEASTEDIDARLDELEQAFPDVMMAGLLRAMFLADRGESDEAILIVRSASAVPITAAPDLEVLVNIMDALSVSDSKLTADADEILNDYLDDPELGTDAARIKLARGFRWGRLDDMDRCLEVIGSSVTDASDATLGWASLVDEVRSGERDERIANELTSRQSEAAQWWVAIFNLAEAINAKDLTGARELLVQLASMTDEADDSEERDMALALYFASLVDIESGEWRSATTNLTDLGRAYSWRVARQTLASVLLEQGFATDAYVVLRQFPGSDGVLLTESLISLRDTNPDNTELVQNLSDLAVELEEKGADEPRVLILAARAYLAIGDLDEALRVASLALDSPDALTTDQIIPLVIRVARLDAGAAKRLLERISIEDAATYSYLWSENPANELEQEALVASLLSRIEQAQDNDKLTLKRQLIDVYVRLKRPEDAVEVMRQISSEHDGNTKVQLQILGAQAAWSDEELIESAIGRLRASAGEEAIRWQIYALRSAMLFDKDPDAVAKATNALAAAIRLRPDDPQALAMMGEALVFQGNMDGAATYLTRAVAADSRVTVYLVQLIEVLLQSGDVAEADRRLGDLAAVPAVSDEVRRARASLLARLGRRDEAIADLQLLRKKSNPDDLLSLGLMLVRQGELDGAEEVFDEMLQLEGVSDEAVITMADFVSIHSGDLARGEEVLEHLGDRENARASFLKASFYERHGELEQAERLFKEAVQTDKDLASPALAMFLLRQGRLGEAKALCEQNAPEPSANGETTSDPQILASIGQIASICEDMGPDTDEVNAILGALNDAGSATTLLQLANALDEFSKTRATEQPNYQRLVNQLASITDSDPTFFAAWRMRVWAKMQQASTNSSESAVALATARSAARTVRDDPRMAGLAVGVLMQLKQWDEAMFAAREWRDRSLADPFDAEFTIAAIHIIRREFDQAFRVIDPWWREGKGDARVTDARLTVVASALAGVGRIDDAHDLLWQPDSTDTAWAIRYLQIAEILEKDRPQAARDWIKRIESLLIRTPVGRFEIGRRRYELAIQTGVASDYEEVVRVLTPLTSDEQFSIGAFSLLGICFDQLERYADAISSYEAALVSSPDQPTLLNNLAYAILRVGGDSQRAVDLATRAIASATNWDAEGKANLHDTLGSALLEAGRPADALEEFRLASLTPSAGISVHLGIGESLAALGEIEEARAELAQITQMQVRDPIQDAYIRRRLADLARFVSNL